MTDEENNKEENQDDLDIEALKAEASRVKELEEALKEKDEELEKYSTKEFNFKKFKEASKKEQKKMLEKFSEKESTYEARVEALESKIKETEEARFNEVEETFLSKFKDNDFKAKLKDAVVRSNDFRGEPKTPQELEQRFKDAYEVYKSEAPTNPLNTFTPTTTYIDDPNSKRKKFGDKPEQYQNLQNWFGTSIFPNKKD